VEVFPNGTEDASAADAPSEAAPDAADASATEVPTDSSSTSEDAASAADAPLLVQQAYRAAIIPDE
jgi:hypothetical protein